MAADMLLGHHAGLAVGSHAMSAGAHQSTLLPQSLLMAQHHGAQQLLVARQDPSSLLQSHAGLVGHHSLTSASGLAVLPGVTAQGLHDYQHGFVGQHSAVARGEMQAGLSQAEVNAASTGLQQHGAQVGSWPSEQQVQPTSHQDPTDRPHK